MAALCCRAWPSLASGDAIFPPESGSSTAADVLAGDQHGRVRSRTRWPGPVRPAPAAPASRDSTPCVALIRPLESIQSGVVNDYVTWIILGVACIGGVLAYAIR